MSGFDQSVIEAARQLAEAGFALHWLHPKAKRPINRRWSTLPRQPIDDLLADHVADANLGVRLGEPSELTTGGFLHAIDIDIRDDRQADDTTSALIGLLKGIDIAGLALVKSGSGGKSRHLYFVTDRPFYSKKLAHSEGKSRGPDGKWHYDWEIELFGTGKQVVLPPSIHPETGQPYEWVRPFDFAALELGIVPTIPANLLDAITEAHSETYEFETREPLTFKSGQLESTLDDIPDERVDDYHDWVLLGQALHHQFGASDEGYRLWVDISKRSEKFNERGMASKWRGFGRSRRQPVTMASVVHWVTDARQQAMVAEFDEVDDGGDGFEGESQSTAPPPETPGNAADLDDFLEPASRGAVDIDDLLGEGPTTDTEAAPVEKKSTLDWFSMLEFDTEKKVVKSTLHNISLIVRHDERIRGIPQLNEFTNEIVQRRSPGKQPSRARAAKPTKQLDGAVWEVQDALNGSMWSETHDYSLRDLLEGPKSQGGYNIKVSDRDLRAAVDTAAKESTFHPVREYLSTLKWDGVKRLDTLFVDYLGAPDNAYTRAVARLALSAAVTRVFEPGHKFDYAVILEGLQGKRKSTFIAALGKSWFAELDGDFHDQKQMVELMQGAWIMEIPELSGFQRSDVRAIKAFISRTDDKVRLAYARRAKVYARQCIFIGSTNDREYLKDDTGGRRFWPMVCTVSEIDVERLEAEIDQYWAEGMVVYQAMRKLKPVGRLPLYLTDPEALAIAAELQEARRVHSAEDQMLGVIKSWLNTPIVSGDGFDDEDGETYRDKTCAIEIAVEAMGYSIKDYARDRSVAFQIGRAMLKMPGWEKSDSQHRFDRWDKQRTFVRIS